ncbi:MAG: MFS transporter [Actinomycetota bacterium]|nr:MFS transporter [Actinomycetota bacterium]
MITNNLNENTENQDDSRDLTFLDAGGVDEVSVIPWSLLLRQKIVERAGVSRRKATLTVLLSCVFTVSFMITLLVVSLKTVADDLNSSTSVISWAITAPMLAFGVVGPAFGKVGDLWGHKRVFVGGLLIAGIFSLMTAFSWSAPSMIVFRTLSAAGGSALGPAAMAYINRMFDPSERVRPLGYWSFVTAGAPVIGVVAGVPLVAIFGWRTIFLIQAPLCLIGCLVALWLLGDTERRKNVKFDILGAVLLGLGSVLILLAINRGPSWGFGSSRTLIVAVFGFAALYFFVRVEQVASEPMLPLKWFRTRNVAFPVMSQAMTNFAYMGGFLLVPQLLENGLGYSTSHIGWLIIARPLVFSLVAPLSGRIAMRIGERNAGVIGACAVLASMLTLSQVTVGSSDLMIAFGLSLSGMGLGIASPALTALLVNSVENKDLGVASATQQLLNQMGAVLGAAVMVGVHEATLSFGVIRSYSFALLTGALSSGLGIFAASAVRSSRRR